MIIKFYTSLINILRANAKLRFAFLFLVFASLSLFMIHVYYPKGLTNGFDLYFHLERFLSISEAIRAGHFPFYIDSLAFNQYGYATNLFYPDFWIIPFAYLAHIIGFISAYKWMLIAYTIACGMLTYYCINKIFNNSTHSLISSILYTFSAFHLMMMSTIGGVSGFLAFAFIPLVFYGTYEIIYGDYRNKWYIIGIGFSCLITIHILTALMTFLVLCIFLLIFIKRLLVEPKRCLFLLFAAILSILLSSFFLLPMLEQMKDNTFYFTTNPLVKHIADHSTPFGEMFLGLFKGFGETTGESDLGILLILPLIARLFIRKRDKNIRLADLLMFVGFALAFMCTELFPWGVFPFNRLSIIQFPRRFLVLANLFMACSCGCYLSYLSKKINWKILLIISIYLLTTLMIQRQGHSHVPAEIYTNDVNQFRYQITHFSQNTSTSEYIPSNVPSTDFIIKRKDLLETSDSLSSTSNLKRGHNRLEFDINTKGTNAILPLLYYKGYKASINGVEAVVSQSKYGLIEVKIPTSGHLVVWFAGTLLQRISIIISLLSLLGFCFYLFYQATTRRTTISTIRTHELLRGQS